MLSAISKTPEIALDPGEAKALAEPIVQLDKLYGRKQNAKALAWANLAMVAGGIYGTRIVAIRNRRVGERARPVGPGIPAPQQAAPEQPGFSDPMAGLNGSAAPGMH